jgi:hypothetical protein
LFGRSLPYRNLGIRELMRTARLDYSIRTALCLLLTLIFLQIGVRGSSKSTLRLSDNDKARIVRSVLRRALGKHSKVRTIPLLINENVRREWLPIMSNVEFDLFDQPRILEVKDQPVSYFFIDRFEIKGQKVRVWFGKHDQEKRSSSGTGTIYEYARVSGKWRGKAVEGFGYCAAPGHANQ